MDLPPVAVAASLAVTAFAIFAALYVLAARFLYEVALHDLKLEATRLREEYARRLEALRKGAIEVDILPDEEVEEILPEPPAAAA